ncbi:MAG: alpha/beta hydrolase-fold protein [Gemmatimonadales bacterium]|nr:alpha/beta hydrolase-fold protein [Gemmatimonadales bacterium]
MPAHGPRPLADPMVECYDFRADANGSDYEVRVGLPPSYHQGTARYPLLLVLDADLMFGMTHETATIEALWARAPLGYATPRVAEVIVVGIALPDRLTNPFRRNFEYMPDANPAEYAPETVAYLARVKEVTGAEPRYGGAPTLQDFLATELFPFFERTYRVDPARRIFFGQSAGGTFGCYTLLTRPDLFADYVIVSPGMTDQCLFRLEAAWAAGHDDLRARVFLSAGEREVLDPFGIAGNTVRLAEKLAGRRYPGLELETWIVPEASHVQTAAPSLARALGFFAGATRG